MKTYDIILSLGGSCAIANQLKVRGLRLASYPFDWIFTREPDSLLKLADCFKEDFVNWLRPENLVDIDPCEQNPSAAKYQYRDAYTGYRFIHDFHRPKDEVAAEVREKYMRRIKRMYDRLNKAKRIALCFDASYQGSRAPIMAIRSLLMEKFGRDKEVDCYLVEFLADRHETINEDHLTVFRFTHPKNDYIFHGASFEFMFMDDFQVSDRFKSEERGKGNKLYLVHTAHGIKCILFKNKRKRFSLDVGIGRRKYEFSIGAK